MTTCLLVVGFWESCLFRQSELATEVVLHWTVHLDDEIRSQNIYFRHSSYSLMPFQALGSWGRAKTSLTRIDFAVPKYFCRFLEGRSHV